MREFSSIPIAVQVNPAVSGFHSPLAGAFLRGLAGLTLLFALIFISALAQAEPAEKSSAPWSKLATRLQADGVYTDDVQQWVSALPAYSARPMGGKIRSVFRYKFMVAPFRFFYKPQKTPQVQPGMITDSTVRKCLAYLEKHKEVFDSAEARYNVPRRIIASLLMMETHLGTYIGESPAFWSLACMAASDNASSINEYIKDLPLNAERKTWINEQLSKRSAWAYKELKALLTYCHKNGHNPLELKGSVYGAIGFCQFMPSNIPAYAADGDGDGKIDVFSHADAIHSVARYLNVHGWKEMQLPIARQKEIIRKYNHSNVYANTISGIEQAIVKHEAAQKAAAAKSDAAKTSTN